MQGLKKIRLGELLIQQGLITEQQLTSAMEEQHKTGLKLGNILVNRGILSEEALLQCLAKQLDIPLFDLRRHKLIPEVVQKLSEAYARRFRAIILEERDGGYLVGVSDPFDLNATDEIQRVLKKPVKFALVRENDLLRTLDLMYRRTQEISTYAEALDESVEDGDRLIELDYQAEEADAPVVKLLRSLFEDAVQVGASDIHIEPDARLLRIRLRVDGILQEQLVKEYGIARAIVTRLKLMAGLNISEHRLPQDGRFNIKVRQHVIDIRISVMPTQHGESVVMRLLNQTGGTLSLESVGMSGVMLQEFRNLLSYPNGVILVTGPTGSGKTTTLNAAIRELNTPERKIITVEDPVEYRLERVTQVHVNQKVGLTFATVLRSALRQDPDVILVGEMRDQETASVAIRAALTGHLVLSTLHTNDAASSALRLMDMGVEGFLLSSTLRGILAQRLVRRICPNCSAEYPPDAHERNWLTVCDYVVDGITFKQGKGCNTCNHSGYRGRIAIFELLELTYPMLEALRVNNTDGFMQLATAHLKGKLLVDYAMGLVQKGLTTLTEVIRVGGDH